MELLDRVKDTPFICGVELAFNGELSPSSIPDWQPFYNSSTIATDFAKTHIGFASVSFEEESQESPAGTSYKQSCTFRFPATDARRSERIALMDRVRFVKLNLTNGLDLVIGRNDIQQNARPRINIKTNTKTAEAKFETVSITSSGFVSDASAVGLPTLIPISLYL